jgi:hypothetical protein
MHEDELLSLDDMRESEEPLLVSCLVEYRNSFVRLLGESIEPSWMSLIYLYTERIISRDEGK